MHLQVSGFSCLIIIADCRRSQYEQNLLWIKSSALVLRGLHNLYSNIYNVITAELSEPETEQGVPSPPIPSNTAPQLAALQTRLSRMGRRSRSRSPEGRSRHRSSDRVDRHRSSKRRSRSRSRDKSSRRQKSRERSRSRDKISRYLHLRWSLCIWAKAQNLSLLNALRGSLTGTSILCRKRDDGRREVDPVQVQKLQLCILSCLCIVFVKPCRFKMLIMSADGSYAQAPAGKYSEAADGPTTPSPAAGVSYSCSCQSTRACLRFNTTGSAASAANAVHWLISLLALHPHCASNVLSWVAAKGSLLKMFSSTHRVWPEG